MNTQIVNSYASAFYDMANESGKLNRFVEEVDTLTPIFRDPEVVAFFKSPVYSASDKEKVVETTFGNKVDAVLGDFLKLLAKNGRLHLFPAIIEEFKNSLGDGKGSRKGEITSASDLSDSEKQGIKASLEKKLGGQVQLDFKTDKELLGGVEARVGSYVIEDSLKSDLKKLNESLKRSAH